LLRLIPFLLVLSVSSAYTQTNKILFNGKIVTSNLLQPEAEAVAIADDRIVYVGTLTEAKKSVPDDAVMIDLQGKFLLPGLIDSHNHAISGGESLLSATLNDELLSFADLASFAASTLQSKKGMYGDVLFIDGVHSGTWASVNELHNLFNSREYESQAVVLQGSDGHTAWANNVMLKRAGIDPIFLRRLKDGEQRYFGFDKNFVPNGMIAEDGFKYIRKVLPSNNIDQYQAGIAGVKHLNRLGITAWMDPSAGSVKEGEKNGELNIYKKLSDSGVLTAHVAAIVVADANENYLPQIHLLKTLREKFSGVKNVSVIGFKIFADGVMEYPTQTAAVSMPYKNSGHTGSLMVEPEKLNRFVVAADREKFLVHIHAIGDRATTVALDAFGSTRTANKNSTIPHSITHLQMVRPSDFKRFADLNVIASMQLLWATADIYTEELVKPYVDAGLYEFHYPAASLINAGAMVCGASDWPVSSANPFEAMHIAETRTGKLGVLNASQVVTRRQMLDAYTINAAKAMMTDRTIGSIEKGKAADFVLVDRDVLHCSPEDVKSTKVLWTMFGGQFVFAR
jgi:predicted amidohydrolase YtcJ